MPRTYGEEFPERALMGVISDLLQIDHFTTARGSTVRKDFLVTVALGLGVPSASIEGLTKDEVLALVVERATRRPASSSTYSPGATVKNDVLQEIVDGIVANDLQAAILEPGPEQDVTFGTPEQELADLRTRHLMLALVREGQSRFRNLLLEAYSERCAVTETDAPEALDAAHIRPYSGPPGNVVTNGLLLRADIHRLFDRGALAIDEETMRVSLRPSLLATTYADLEGKKLRLPRRLRDRPSKEALRGHRLWAGL